MCREICKALQNWSQIIKMTIFGHFLEMTPVSVVVIFIGLVGWFGLYDTPRSPPMTQNLWEVANMEWTAVV